MTDEPDMIECPDCNGTGETEADETDDELEQRCEEMLNDIYGEIDVCGYKYDAGRLLKEVDPIAFRVAASEMDTMTEECPLCEGTGEVQA